MVTAYTPSIENGRPVLQGLLAIDYLTKEVNFNFKICKIASNFSFILLY